jgi:hypothetical protein
MPDKRLDPTPGDFLAGCGLSPAPRTNHLAQCAGRGRYDASDLPGVTVPLENDVANTHQTGTLHIDHRPTLNVTAKQDLSGPPLKGANVEPWGGEIRSSITERRYIRRCDKYVSSTQTKENPGDLRVRPIDEPHDNVANGADPLSPLSQDGLADQLREVHPDHHLTVPPSLLSVSGCELN